MPNLVAPLVCGAVFSIAAAQTALAHANPNILTVFEKDARTDRTDGVSIEHVAGVHLYRGSQRVNDLLAGASETRAAPESVNIEVTLRYTPRSFRSLRTQGFYAGYRPKSRRYTQGFYSGG
jgi:hypothetical protein